MDLKLTEHVRNTISLLYRPNKKPGEIPIFETLFSEKINFDLYFDENRHFQVGHVILRHCDCGTKQLNFGRVNFKLNVYCNESITVFTVLQNHFTSDLGRSY